MSRSATGAEAGGVAGAEAIMRELYTRPLHASGRGGIGRVVLAAFAAHAVGRDELGGDEFDGVAVLPEESCPVVGAGAGFHADQAGRELGDQGRQLFACDPGFDQCGLAVFIDTVNGKHVLGEIDTNCHNGHGLPLSWF